jgi:hypothetical protein
MKKKIAIVSISLWVIGLFYFSGISKSIAHDTGAPAACTGSPFDIQTCDVNSCHNSHPLQSPQPWITSNVPVTGYVQNTIYTIIAKAVTIGDGSFGFEISPQTLTGAPLGTLIANPPTTQIVAFGALQYMTHTINSYQGTDSVVWTFQWKAPVAGSGSVKFYGAFNCGNGNSVATGTFVYPATLVIPESSGDGINTIENEQTFFSVFPNPAGKYVNITYTLKQAQMVEINIYAMDGRKISTLSNNMENEGEHTQTSSFPSEIKPGIYLIQLVTNNQSNFQRIIIE